MKLPLGETGVEVKVGRDRAVAVVVPFVDDRPDKEVCGNPDATCDGPPGAWLATRLITALNDSGFKATSAGSGTPGVLVEGTLRKLFVEPVIGSWTSSMEADIDVSLVVKGPDGLVAKRRFFVKGIQYPIYTTWTPMYELALNRGTRELLTQMVTAIGELLDRYPSAGASL